MVETEDCRSQAHGLPTSEEAHPGDSHAVGCENLEQVQFCGVWSIAMKRWRDFGGKV